MFERLKSLIGGANIAGATAAAKPITDQLIIEIFDGKWGSGDTRKKKLVAAGYDYYAVQKRVTEVAEHMKVYDKTVKTYIVMTSCSNGSITYSNRYIAGQNVIVTIKPKDGYEVKSIKVDNKAVAAATTYKISKINAHHIVSVVCTKKIQPSGKTYPGTLPTLRLKKTNAEVIADTLKWAKWIAGDNRFHYGYGQHAHHNGCYFCGTQRMKKNRTPAILDPDFTYCCNPFVGAAWAHGGCVPKALSLCNNTNSWDFSVGSGYDTSSLFTKLGKPDYSKLKPGDVLCSDGHVALYIGNNKVAQAGHEDDNKRNSSKWNSSISYGSTWNGWKRAYRFNGSVDADIIMRHGEVSKRVEQWQKFLDWCYGGAFFKECGGADGYFGDNTLKWTKKFQEQYIGKGEGDGLCGNKTFEAAKKVTKK